MAYLGTESHTHSLRQKKLKTFWLLCYWMTLLNIKKSCPSQYFHATDMCLCTSQPAYVLQIFPPCEFSESHLSQLAPDLLNRISSISPHLMIVITSVWRPLLGGWIFSLMSLRKPEEYFFFFFLDTVGMCRISPINTFLFFLSPSVFFFSSSSSFVFMFFPLSCHSCLVYLSFSKELRDGSNQNESYLTISLLYFYLLEFYFNIQRCSEEGRKEEKKSGCLMNDSLRGLFLSSVLIDC